MERDRGVQEKRGREACGRRRRGVEEAGSGILKVAGSRRNREKLCNVAKYFANIKKSAKRREPTNIGQELGLTL